MINVIKSHLFINFFNQKEGSIQIEMRKILKNLFTDQSDSGLLVSRQFFKSAFLATARGR